MITIIGAGPAGCFSAMKLAKAGHEVTVFEEHEAVGRPVQCTGLVTSSIADLVDMDKGFVINKIDTARIFSPNGKFLEVKFKRPDLVLDRRLFDKHIAQMAQDAGATIRAGVRFAGTEGNCILLRTDHTEKLEFSHLIGADGPLSDVAKSSGMFGKREFWHGAQARVRLANDNSIQFYPYIGAFAWVVPEDNNTARIGVLAKTGLKDHFRSFLKRFDCKLIELQGGMVPIYSNHIKTQLNNIYLVGDAAAQVKATTGGGIIPSLKAAEALSDSIISGSDYTGLWRKAIGKDLYLSLKVRAILDKMSHDDYDKLVHLCSSPKAKEVFENIDRDHTSSMLLRLFFAQPNLLSFGSKIF